MMMLPSAFPRLRSSSGHSCSTFGTGHLIARLSRCMGSLVPATRTHAFTARSSSELAAHSAASASAATSGRSCSVSSGHNTRPFRSIMFVSRPVPSAAPEPSLAAATARHQEGTAPQSPIKKGRQHLLDAPAGPPDHLYPRSRNRHFQRPGNRPTDQHIHPGLRQACRPFLQTLHLQCHFLSLLLGGAVIFDQQQPCSHVKYRADPPLPIWDGDLHLSNK